MRVRDLAISIDGLPWWVVSGDLQEGDRGWLKSDINPKLNMDKEELSLSPNTALYPWVLDARYHYSG